MTLSSSVTFCDDIRVESSGKLILIGVYPEDLVPSTLPQVAVLSAWVRLRGMTEGSHKIHFTFGANGQKQHEAEMDILVPAGKGSAQLHLVGLPIQLNDYGHIFITLTGLPGGETMHEELPVVQPVKRN